MVAVGLPYNDPLREGAWPTLPVACTVCVRSQDPCRRAAITTIKFQVRAVAK
ncbi:unnamed protein product [Chondrus crispus]|uniref:Uncharacterized protein n=1 Tax=Chondrus crispus TaxID=2769 RepID=R7QHI8_CHOCR|nr:unnamed protein product [Chondrus crispus]CDF36895.1 unnamed protein product [Chondrus crispus]|eukprot:XP_005716714.1 unnamed protein product [Chondrus crispus]